MRPAIFLDRDGVIIENLDGYVRSWNDVTFIPGALESLAAMAATPYAIVIATNQAGVGRGLIPLTEAEAINERLCDEIIRAGGRVDGLYMCPHRPEDECECRKPRPGMLRRAAYELALDLSRSWMIGDALTDLQAGKAAGAHTLLVLTGRGMAQKRLHRLGDGYPDLPAALEHIRLNGG
jgi:D-glycero-D-manno-heptose 1,7-bisphosphate phosphatase